MRIIFVSHIDEANPMDLLVETAVLPLAIAGGRFGGGRWRSLAIAGGGNRWSFGLATLGNFLDLSNQRRDILLSPH